MRTCPMCGKEYDGYPALSRKDNKTEICSDCGMVEALADFFGYQPEFNAERREEDE